MPRRPVPEWLPLASELRRLRSLSGLPTREVAERTGLSKARVSRVELGQSLLSRPEVEAWAGAVSADGAAVDRLLRLAETAHTTVEPFHRTLAGVPHLQDVIRDREAAARAITVLQAAIIPGLLQTPPYARRVISLVDPTGSQDLAAAVAARLQRQEVLFDPSKHFHFLITEGALRWPGGPPAVMRAAYDRILNVSTLDNVRVGLVPTQHDPKALPPDGFTIYGDLEDDQTPYVVAELPHAQIKVAEPADVAIYQELVQLTAESALYGGKAIAFLSDLGASLQDQV